MSGFLPLCLAILFSSGVAVTMKIANAGGIRLGPFLAVNYLVCTATLMAWGAWRTLALNPPLVWLLGIFVGGMYVLCLWLFDRSIAAGGLAISTTLMRLSAALPTLGSLVLFAEPAGRGQILGIVLAFACLPLASRDPLRFDAAGRDAWKGITWGLVLFAAYGVTDFIFKVQAEMIPAADPIAFMATIFGSALLITLPQFFGNTRPDRRCIRWGAVLGATNVLATAFWIRTLAHLPGTVAFPTLGLGVIAVTTVAGVVFWHERLRPANQAFLVLATAAVLLINAG